MKMVNFAGFPNSLRRLARTSALIAVACLLSTPLLLAQRPGLQINGYVINADLDPATHHLTATAKVTFTPGDSVDTVIFQLHNALKVSKVTDESGKVLEGERGQDATIRLTPATPLTKGTPTTWTFQYDGTLSGTEEGPVEGLKLTFVGDPISYLLYPGRWFPMSGYLTNRFTAEIHVRIPSGYWVLGSGSQGAPHAATANGRPAMQFDFNWPKPGFPGTIIAGKFEEPSAVSGSTNVRVYLTKDHQKEATGLAQTAAQQFEFFTNLFGISESHRLNVVELPDDTVPAFWAPEIAAIAGSHLGSDRTSARLLANTMARQWWGNQVSPMSLNDGWITNGMARYAELMYVEDQSGKAALSSAVLDISAGALAYDTIPLSSAGRLSPFSPEYQSMTLDKGGMVWHMLRWQIGDDAFKKTLLGILSQYADKGVRTSDVQKVAEAQSQQQLTPFFAQWLDGTGAPQFNNKYAVYRLGNNKGFRTIGEINQDLDLFRMPVELRIETDGKTETQKIDVVGTNSQYTVDTFGRPRHITIDPDNWLLKNTPDLRVRVSILRGQQMVAQGDIPGALQEYQKALTANPQSSLASYRIGEALFTQRNYQASANAYRDALRGDGEPRWTEVWSHIQLGKIFDVTGQRDRAVNEYRQALQTNDNTQGALNEARQYLQAPYKRPDSQD